MAEVIIGLAASSWTLSTVVIHIARNVVILHDFINDFKTAPKDSQRLICEVGDLTRLLELRAKEAEENISCIGEAGARVCLDHCFKAAEELGDVARKIEEGMRRRKSVGRVWAVLRGKEVERLRGRLDSAKTSLLLSEHVVTRMMLKRELERSLQLELANRDFQQLQIGILQSIDVRLNTKHIAHNRIVAPPSLCSRQRHHAILPFPSCSVTSTITKTISRRATSNMSGIILSNRIDAISWPTISNIATEITCFVSLPRVFGNTKINKPYGSLIFPSIAMGDISAVQAHFQLGLLTPTHRSPSGTSIFEFAVMWQKIEICCFLLEQGAIVEVNDYNSLAHTLRWPNNIPPQQHLELVQLLVQDTKSRRVLRRILNGRMRFSGDPIVSNWILHQPELKGRCETLDECAKLALHVAAQPQLEMAALIRLCLKTHQISPRIAQMRDESHTTLLHYTTRSLGELFFQSPAIFERYLLRSYGNHDVAADLDSHAEDFRLFELATIIRELVMSCTKLYRRSGRCKHRFSEGRTPFLEIFSGYFHKLQSWCFRRSRRSLTEYILKPFVSLPLVRVYLDILQGSNIDLESYGQKEKSVHNRDYFGRSWSLAITSVEFDKRWGILRGEDKFFNFALQFTYGSRIEDWKVWLIEEFQDCFLEFWDMVDCPERALPGAWIDHPSERYRIGPGPKPELFSDDSESDWEEE